MPIDHFAELDAQRDAERSAATPKERPPITVSALIDVLMALRDAGHGDLGVVGNDREGEYPIDTAEILTVDRLLSDGKAYVLLS